MRSGARRLLCAGVVATLLACELAAAAECAATVTTLQDGAAPESSRIQVQAGSSLAVTCFHVAPGTCDRGAASLLFSPAKLGSGTANANRDVTRSIPVSTVLGAAVDRMVAFFDEAGSVVIGFAGAAACQGAFDFSVTMRASTAEPEAAVVTSLDPAAVVAGSAIRVTVRAPPCCDVEILDNDCSAPLSPAVRVPRDTAVEVGLTAGPAGPDNRVCFRDTAGGSAARSANAYRSFGFRDSFIMLFDAGTAPNVERRVRAVDVGQRTREVRAFRVGAGGKREYFLLTDFGFASERVNPYIEEALTAEQVAMLDGAQFEVAHELSTVFVPALMEADQRPAVRAFLAAQTPVKQKMGTKCPIWIEIDQSQDPMPPTERWSISAERPYEEWRGEFGYRSCFEVEESGCEDPDAAHVFVQVFDPPDAAKPWTEFRVPAYSKAAPPASCPDCRPRIHEWHSDFIVYGPASFAVRFREGIEPDSKPCKGVAKVFAALEKASGISAYPPPAVVVNVEPPIYADGDTLTLSVVAGQTLELLDDLTLLPVEPAQTVHPRRINKVTTRVRSWAPYDTVTFRDARGFVSVVVELTPERHDEVHAMRQCLIGVRYSFCKYFFLGPILEEGPSHLRIVLSATECIEGLHGSATASVERGGAVAPFTHSAELNFTVAYSRRGSRMCLVTWDGNHILVRELPPWSKPEFIRALGAGRDIDPRGPDACHKTVQVDQSLPPRPASADLVFAKSQGESTGITVDCFQTIATGCAANVEAVPFLISFARPVPGETGDLLEEFRTPLAGMDMGAVGVVAAPVTNLWAIRYFEAATNRSCTGVAMFSILWRVPYKYLVFPVVLNAIPLGLRDSERFLVDGETASITLWNPSRVENYELRNADCSKHDGTNMLNKGVIRVLETTAHEALRQEQLCFVEDRGGFEVDDLTERRPWNNLRVFPRDAPVATVDCARHGAQGRGLTRRCSFRVVDLPNGAGGQIMVIGPHDRCSDTNAMPVSTEVMTLQVNADRPFELLAEGPVLVGLDFIITRWCVRPFGGDWVLAASFHQHMTAARWRYFGLWPRASPVAPPRRPRVAFDPGYVWEPPGPPAQPVAQRTP